VSDLNSLISDHPGLTAVVILTIQGVLTWLWASLKWFVVREFKAMEVHEKRQDGCIANIEARLNKNDIAYAVSSERFELMFTMIKGHVEKEDEQHARMEDIRERLAGVEMLLRRNGR